MYLRLYEQFADQMKEGDPYTTSFSVRILSAEKILL